MINIHILLILLINDAFFLNRDKLTIVDFEKLVILLMILVNCSD